MIYQDFSDEQLINLLFTERDRLSRVAVDEFVRRGGRMVKPLAEIVNNNFAWTRDVPEWWAVVHSVFILGVIGTEETVVPLLKSLRFSCAYDCDWVTEQLPSIFGKIGIKAVKGLKMIASDWTTDWFTRVKAVEGLAAITISNLETREDAFVSIGCIFCNETEDKDVRALVGNILLDFQREEFKDELLDFGRIERALKDKDAFYNLGFDDEDVEQAFSSLERDLRQYQKDWLFFYDENEIKGRQERWEEEEKNLLEREREKKPVGSLWKIGRNDPCFCGSGKKYKKCCGK